MPLLTTKSLQTQVKMGGKYGLELADLIVEFGDDMNRRGGGPDRGGAESLLRRFCWRSE